MRCSEVIGGARLWRRGATAFLMAVALTNLLPGASLGPSLRRPISLIPVGDGDKLVILNQRLGSASVLDLTTRAILFEQSIADGLSGGCKIDATVFAAVDASGPSLAFCRFDHDRITTISRLTMPATPRSVAMNADRRIASVASTWARQVTLVSFADLTDPKRLCAVDLPFAPREQLFLDDRRLLVADAFGGWLAMIDVTTGEVIKSRELRATHNISGLTLSSARDLVYLPHQMLSDEEATTASNVHWGDVMSNVVRRLNLEWFLSDRPEETTAADLYYLGYPDSAAGDPTGLVVTDREQLIVCLAGVDEVAISDHGLNHFRRLAVGRRPLAQWLDSAHETLYVANQLDDSVSIVDLKRAKVVATVQLGEMPPLTLADEGERLFYDARLSSDGWFSCHSCHTEGHSNGRSSDTFGDEYQGSAKRVLSLLGTAETRPWAWNGQVPTLEAQIQKSIETTMHGPQPSSHQVQALAAYLMSLSPPPSIDVARGSVAEDVVERGRLVFNREGCVDCHQPPLYTSAAVYDVGLVDADGQRMFNPPSLLGVAHRPLLLHDRRAKDIREALQIHPRGEPVELGDAEWLDLGTFLRSL